MSAISNAIQNMVNGLQNLFVAMIDLFANAVNAIGNTLSSLANPIGYLIGVLAVFGSLITIIYYVFRGRGGISGLVGGIKGFFTSFL
jgi:Flp pilus assembly pilin Flp